MPQHRIPALFDPAINVMRSLPFRHHQLLAPGERLDTLEALLFGFLPC